MQLMHPESFANAGEVLGELVQSYTRTVESAVLSAYVPVGQIEVTLLALERQGASTLHRTGNQHVGIAQYADGLVVHLREMH